MTAEPAAIERILAGFAARYREGSPFAEDRRLADELALEARPAVEALAFAMDHADDPVSIEHHEAQAMITLLGRRAGALGATPTAAGAIVACLAAGFRDVDRPLPDALVSPLSSLALEGYVAGREEALERARITAAVQAAPIVTVVPGGLALFLAGDHEPEALNEIVERFGREIFDTGATVCIVEASGLLGPSRDRAVELFGADATARMLGASCVFANVAEGWRDAGRAARIELEVLTIDPSFEAALRRMLGQLDFELKRTSWLPAPLDRLLGKK